MIIGRTRLRRQDLPFHSSSSSRPSCLPSLSLLSFFRVFRPWRAFRCCSRCRLIATVPDNFVVGPPCLPSISCLPFYPLPPPCPIFLYTFFDFSQFSTLIFLNFIFLIHFPHYIIGLCRYFFSYLCTQIPQPSWLWIQTCRGVSRCCHPSPWHNVKSWNIVELLIISTMYVPQCLFLTRFCVG